MIHAPGRRIWHALLLITLAAALLAVPAAPASAAPPTGADLACTITLTTDIQETADCTQLAGQGTFVLRIPTSGGIATVAGTFDTSGSAAGAVVTGDLTGTAHVTAVLEGDCVTTPLTRVTTQVDAHVGP